MRIHRSRSFGLAVVLASSLVLAPPLLAQPDAAAQLAAAKAAFERHPRNADSIIWYGRHVGYSGDFEGAVAIYTNGLRVHPDEPRMLRHRGHRYISLRQFDRAIADLERARAVVAGRPDEVEPDGRPNALGIPTGSLQTNIRYHLGLAYYLVGDYARAEPVWAEDVRLAKNDDTRASAGYWWVLTLAHLGRTTDVARVLGETRSDWKVIENFSYHKALLWMKGELPESALLPPDATPTEQATLGNAIGQWHAANGRTAQARAAWSRVLAGGPAAAFGFIAAEQGMKRLTNP